MPKNRILIGRRAFLFGLGTLAGGGALTMASGLGYLNNPMQAISDEERDFAVVGEATLRDRAAVKGLIYGASSPRQALSSNAKFAAQFVKECAILVPDGEFYWKTLHPSPDRFNFAPGDWQAKFAREHGLLLGGHPLLWQNVMPKWVKETVNSKNAEQVMLKHITTVVKHYAGQMYFWNVVNEGVYPPDGRSDGLRKKPWLQFLGPDYIDTAFRATAEADPKAMLVYNEFGLDYDRPKDEAKRKSVMKLLERLKSNGTPVQALGMQAHLDAGERRFNPRKLQAFLSDVADLGLKILITELDVTDRRLPLNTDARDRIVARVYEDYLSVVLNEPAVIAVLTWGLSDRYTWLSKEEPRKDGAPVRPMPLDAELKRKLSWNAMARAFDKAPIQQI